MSGGHFDYAQYRISNMAESIYEIIRDAREGGKDDFTDETLEKFKIAVKYLNIAYNMAHRIDWLLSGDDGEDTFHERWAEDVEPLIKEPT